MKAQEGKAIISDCKARGYVLHGNVLYPPEQAKALNITASKKKTRSRNLVKTGDVNDERNIKNKLSKIDMFITLVRASLSIDPWPEFYFSMDRQYRFDYAIPEYKIAIEQNGGIWSKGNSGHSSGKGIQRDMDKGALAASLGWTIISRSPDQMLTIETMDFIQSAINNKKI